MLEWRQKRSLAKGVLTMNSRQELQGLIDILAQVISVVTVSSVADPTERERKTDAHNLANRFTQYAMTVLHLSDDRNSVNLPSFGDIRVLDSASIDILARAAMEAFLVFHHIYHYPSTGDEGEFRYWTYKVIGLAERQGLPEGTFEHQKQKDEEKKRIEGIIGSLEANPIFKNLTQRQKEGIATGHKRDLWRWNSNTNRKLYWSEIAVDAGLSKMMAQHMYSHLSGHAHSGSLSVLQTQQAVVRKEVEKLITPSLYTMKILTANMINEYTAVFKDAHDKLSTTGTVKFVETWVEVGRRLDEDS